MPMSCDGREDLALDPAAHQRILDLQCDDPVDALRAADRVDAHLRETDVAHVTGLHQLGDRADRLLDRHLGIEPRGLVQIDAIGSQAVERVGERGLDRGWARVVAEPVAGRVALRPELDLDERRVAAAARKRLADEQFVVRPFHRSRRYRAIGCRDPARQWIVAMLSASSAAPYMPDIAMQPSPTAKSRGPSFPSERVRFMPSDSPPALARLATRTRRRAAGPRLRPQRASMRAFARRCVRLCVRASRLQQRFVDVAGARRSDAAATVAARQRRPLHAVRRSRA